MHSDKQTYFIVIELYYKCHKGILSNKITCIVSTYKVSALQIVCLYPLCPQLLCQLE